MWKRLRPVGQASIGHRGCRYCRGRCGARHPTSVPAMHTHRGPTILWRVGEHAKLEVKLDPQPPRGATATLTGGLGRQVACFCAFVAYPAAVLGLRVAVRGATYDTDAGWLRAVGVALGLSLRWPFSELGC